MGYMQLDIPSLDDRPHKQMIVYAIRNPKIRRAMTHYCPGFCNHETRAKADNASAGPLKKRNKQMIVSTIYHITHELPLEYNKHKYALHFIPHIRDSRIIIHVSYGKIEI